MKRTAVTGGELRAGDYTPHFGLIQRVRPGPRAGTVLLTVEPGIAIEIDSDNTYLVDREEL